MDAFSLVVAASERAVLGESCENSMTRAKFPTIFLPNAFVAYFIRFKMRHTLSSKHFISSSRQELIGNFAHATKFANLIALAVETFGY